MMTSLDNMNNPEQMEVISQKRVDHVLQLYETNVSLSEGETFKVIQEEFVFPDSGKAEDPVFLASVSKLAFVKEFVDIALQNDIQGITVDKSIASELLVRGQGKRLFEAPHIYNDFVDLLQLTQDEIVQIKEGYANKSYPGFIKELQQRLDGHQLELVLPLDEVLHLSLSLSTNRILTPIKKTIENELNSHGLDIYQLIKDKYNFGMTISTDNNAHWVQPDPNVGFLSEFVNIVDRIATIDTDTNLLMREKLINNSDGVEFDLTNSDFGKDLIAKGYKIIEKTGYIPLVNWPEDLAKENGAKKGLPPHMSMLTTISILPPDSTTPISFGFKRIVEVKMPWEKITEQVEIGGQTIDLVFPDDTTNSYDQYSTSVYEVVSGEFRQIVVDKTKELLGI